MSAALSPSSPKKRKHHKGDAGPSIKESTKGPSKHKHKHKHRSTDDQFTLVQASLVVSIPPVFASNPTQGVEEMLDSMVMRYIPTLGGVVLTHSNLRFLESKARIQGDSPFATCTVGFDTTVWGPRAGQRLTGKINLCSPDHVSLLVHRTFNVSIPRHHIPKAQWVFQYGPAENDPEYGAGAQGGDGADITMRESEGDVVPGEDAEAPTAEESGGHWVDALTGLPLGGKAGTLDFTVIGMTIANQMLSLVGSIQPDPFAPEHITHAQDVDAPVDAPAPASGYWDGDEEDNEFERGPSTALRQNADSMAEALRCAGEQRSTLPVTAMEKAGKKAEKKAEKKKRKKEKGEAGERKHKINDEADPEGGGRKHKKAKTVDGEEHQRKKRRKDVA